MTIQLGAFFPTRDMPADRLAIRDWAQAAEGLGFDYIEVSDHVLGADRAISRAPTTSTIPSTRPSPRWPISPA